MFKRPIFIAAVLFALTAAVVIKAFPDAFIPDLDIYDRQSIVLTGIIYRIENRKENVCIYLKNPYVSSDPDNGSRPCKRAVLFVSYEDPVLKELKTGNTIRSGCTFREFKTARNFGNYDEEDYYHSLGIFLKAYADDVLITDHHVSWLRQLLYDIRNQMTDSIHASVQDEETAGVLAAICTGDRSGLTDETRILYRKSGIAHILAVSGLHISLLGMGAFRLLRKKLSFKISAAVSCVMMAGLCIMCGETPSAIRAAIMFFIQIIAEGLGKTTDILCSVSLAALIMLAENPLYITGSAFQMSYAAILAIGLIYPELERTFRAKPRNRRKNAGAGIRTGKLRKGFLMSIPIMLATLPVTASAYYEISLYGAVLNVVVIPLMSAVLGSSFFSALIGIFDLLAGRFFIGIGVYLVRFIRWICGLFSDLPFNDLVTGNPSAWRVAVYYLLLFLGLMVMKFLRYLREGDTRKNMIISASYIVFSVTALFLRFPDGRLKVSMIDVDQGDCILLESPHGSVYMIDAGSSTVDNAARYRVEGALKYKGISGIDYFFVTHPDTDHISALQDMLEDGEITISNILIPYIPDNSNYMTLCSQAAANGTELYRLNEGTVLKDGDLIISCLHPDKDYYSPDTNGYSAVLDVRLGYFSALFTGDLGADGEDILLRDHLSEMQGAYDILKVAHHGSRFSSGGKFLDAVSPQIALISAGVNNSYGHPHKETLERLERTGAMIFSTAQFGEIMIEADYSGILSIKTMIGS